MSRLEGQEEGSQEDGHENHSGAVSSHSIQHISKSKDLVEKYRNEKQKTLTSSLLDIPFLCSKIVLFPGSELN